MDLLKEYKRILKDHDLIALATAVNNKPNVRIVNYYENTSKPGIIYISTNPARPKVKEFKENNRVSFTTLTKGVYEFVRVQKATVRPLDLEEIQQVKSYFTNRDASFEDKLIMGEETTAIFAVEFSEASIKRNPVDPYDTLQF
ncbi:pyridoxamine 5'-phosphate oxidase family protein [Bacillus andreraoultii]|uniref:pyridoxamine 5'-phosphate oxidase family protein n=1 Tax=Bacillus andreraoultii TaxID=1499685 RepID=UPI00067F2D9C|nr:pyridoxamine 5'-phosphate oxidase family protein [Bacillus andreraoultii]